MVKKTKSKKKIKKFNIGECVLNNFLPLMMILCALLGFSFGLFMKLNPIITSIVGLIFGFVLYKFITRYNSVLLMGFKSIGLIEKK